MLTPKSTVGQRATDALGIKVDLESRRSSGDNIAVVF